MSPIAFVVAIIFAKRSGDKLDGYVLSPPFSFFARVIDSVV